MRVRVVAVSRNWKAPSHVSTLGPLRVAIVGAGPAGIYAADILSKAGVDVSIDLFERLPAPFGLVRYGVAPDHPRIKQIIVALHKILERGDVRLLANVDYGTDVKLSELRQYYDAIVFSTGAIRDAALPIPGIDLEGSYGAADFVSWYDGHPDVPRTWPLEAREVAVLGAGNVALDVARILSKHADDLLPTDVPANVYEVLKQSPVTDVHIFARRGPAQARRRCVRPTTRETRAHRPPRSTCRRVSAGPTEGRAGSRAGRGPGSRSWPRAPPGPARRSRATACRRRGGCRRSSSVTRPEAPGRRPAPSARRSRAGRRAPRAGAT